MVEVPTVKLALIDPAGTVSEAGTCTSPGLLLESITTAPPPGAAAVSETVPVGCPWLLTDDWLSDTADSAAAPGVEAGAEGVDAVAGAGVEGRGRRCAAAATRQQNYNTGGEQTGYVPAQ